MGLSRLLLAVGLALGPVPASMPSPVRAQERVEPPAEADFREQMKRLDPTTPAPGRSEALRWLSRHSGAKYAPLAVPALGRCIREDPDAGIRASAVGTLARIAGGRREPCPLVIIEAILDKDETVSQTAGAHSGRFKTFAPGTVDVLLRCAGSDDPRLRGECLGHLARAGGKDKKALEVIEKATRDKSFGVRHNARVAMFQATDDLGEFLAYLIRLQEDPDGVLGPVDADSEAAKRERTTRDLASLGAAMLVVEWSDKRPDDLAPALLKLLAAPSPTMRRGAARLIGASAIKVDLADHDWNKLLVGPPEPPKAQEPPQRSNAAVRFEKLKAEDRLRELRDGDPDHTVRAAARIALERIATVREKGPAR